MDKAFGISILAFSALLTAALAITVTIALTSNPRFWIVAGLAAFGAAATAYFGISDLRGRVGR